MLVTENTYYFKKPMSSIIFRNSRFCKINMYCIDWNHISYKTNLFIQVELFYLFPLNENQSIYFRFIIPYTVPIR